MGLALLALCGAAPGEPGIAEGEAALRRGDPVAAVRAFRAELERQPGSWAARDGLGRALRAGGDLEGAERELRRAIEIAPAETAPSRHLLDLLLASPDNARRREGLAWLAAHAGPDADLLLQVARESRLDGDFVTARAALERLRTVSPDSRAALVEEVQVARDALAYVEAEDLCRKIIARFPNFPQAYIHLGRIYRLQERNDEALAAYGRALELDPEEPTALTRLGEILLDRGSLDEAADALTRAIAAAPGMYQPHYLLGRLYLKRGDKQAAQREMDAFRRLKDEMRASARLAGGASMADE